MRWRWGVLFLILLLRFILGWAEAEKYQNSRLIAVSGKPIYIYRNISECVVRVGRFEANFRERCPFSQPQMVRLVGRVEASVTERLTGRLSLNSAQLEVLDEEVVIEGGDGWISQKITALREKMVDRYRRCLPPRESALTAGIVLGYQEDIEREFYDQMVKSGTIHIAVASGYNVMLVGETVLSLAFFFWRRKRATIVAIAVMIFYAFLAGGEPPVIRAVIMAMAVLGSACLGRRVLSLWILLLTGAVMVLSQPEIVGQVSFQLSMMASLGLMGVEPWLRRLLAGEHERLAGWLGEIGVLSTLSTMGATLPIIWWHFGRMSLIGIVSNILILPLIPLMMLLGAGMLILPWVFCWPSYVVAHWMAEAIRFLGM